MSGFHASELGLYAASLLLAGLVLAAGGVSPVGAEEPESAAPQPSVREPIVLAPPTALLPQGGGESDGDPAGDVRRGTTAPDELGVTPVIEGIDVSRLAEIDPESIGILDPDQGGLGSDLWRGTDRRAVERLLPRLPGMMGSATMRDLARRLLLSNAAAPTERPGEAATRSANLLALRIDRLAAMGDFEGLSGLLRVVPQRYDDETTARARAEALLLQGQAEPACQEVRYRVSVHEATGYWRKALVFCQILSGEVDQASLGVALLREEGQQDDPAFFHLVDSLTGLRAEAPAADPVSALHFAMLQAAGLPLPAELLEEASPGLLVSLASTPANGLEQRVPAAERAVTVGLLAPDALTGLYRAYAFDAEQLANAISSAEQFSGPERRALLYQAAWNQTVPSARAEILNVVLEDAQVQGTYPLAVRVYLPLITDIPMEPRLAWFAGTAGRALYTAGRFEQAAAWLTLARQEALINPEAAMAVAVLWPYSRLASGTSPFWEGNLAVWADARSSMAEQDIARSQLLLRTAFQALGESDPMSWTELIGSAPPEAVIQPVPDAALVYALSEASESGRLGETVLLALLALGEAGPANSHPLVLQEVLAALTRVGLVAEARLLAIEAAVGNGI